MRRMLITLAVVGLLAACSTSNGGGGSSESTGTEPSPASSSAASSGASSGASEGAGGGTAGAPSAACEEAFAPLADLGIETSSDLGDLGEVEATVENCESVADWTATAQSTLGIEVRPGTADLLLRIRCDDPSLGSTPICQELASS